MNFCFCLKDSPETHVLIKDDQEINTITFKGKQNKYLQIQVNSYMLPN